MTISEYARTKGVSRQRIYEKLKKADLKPHLLFGDNGQLSDEGIKILDRMTAQLQTTRPPVRPCTPDNASSKSCPNEADQSVTRTASAAESEISALKAKVAELEERNKDLMQTISDIKSDRDAWREQASASTAALTAAQQAATAAQQQTLLLTAANPSAGKTGVFSALKKWLKGNEPV